MATWTTVLIAYADLQPGDRFVEHGVERTVTSVSHRHVDALGVLTTIHTDLDADTVYFASDSAEVLVPDRPVDSYNLARADGSEPGLSHCTCLYRRTDEGWRRVSYSRDCPERCEQQRRDLWRAAFGMKTEG